jgi:hypothetical protein
VLRSTHLAHSIHVDGNILGLTVTDRPGKIEEDAGWIYRRFNHGFYWSAKRDLDAQIGSISRGRDLLYRHLDRSLGHGTRQQEHRDTKMFLDCRHLWLTLAGAPPAA